MKNVIALGLIACAAFVNPAHAWQDGVNPYEVVRNSTAGDCNSEAEETFWTTKATSTDAIVAQREAQTKHYIQAGMNPDVAAKKAQDEVGVIIAQDLENFEIEVELCIAKRMSDVKYMKARKALLEKIDADTKAREEQWAREDAEAAAEAKATPKQQKVAQVAKQAQQVECSPSTGDTLIAQQKQAWSTYMQQRQAIRDMGQGAYDAAQLNDLVNENTAELKMAAEMASDKAEHYFKVCG